MSSPQIVDRVRSRINTLNLTAAAVSRNAGLERTFVHDLISGRKRSVTGEALVALAKALQCSPEYLVGETNTVNTNTLTGTPLVGVAEVGAWRASGVNPVSGTIPLASLLSDPSDASALLVRGSGADKIGITDGSIAIIVPHRDKTPAIGDVLVVQRHRNQLTETSIRQVRASIGGGTELVAPSSKSQDSLPWPSTVSGETITILGQVVKAVTLFTDLAVNN